MIGTIQIPILKGADIDHRIVHVGSTDGVVKITQLNGLRISRGEREQSAGPSSLPWESFEPHDPMLDGALPIELRGAGPRGCALDLRRRLQRYEARGPRHRSPVSDASVDDCIRSRVEGERIPVRRTEVLAETAGSNVDGMDVPLSIGKGLGPAILNHF